MTRGFSSPFYYKSGHHVSEIPPFKTKPLIGFIWKEHKIWERKKERKNTQKFITIYKQLKMKSIVVILLTYLLLVAPCFAIGTFFFFLNNISSLLWLITKFLTSLYLQIYLRIGEHEFGCVRDRLQGSGDT